jgi:hypothetical protein
MKKGVKCTWAGLDTYLYRENNTVIKVSTGDTGEVFALEMPEHFYYFVPTNYPNEKLYCGIGCVKISVD